MKVQLLAIFVLVTYFNVGSAHVDQDIQEWLKQGAGELGETNNLLKHIDTVNEQIKKNLEEQKKALVAIELVEELLAKQNVFLDAQSEVLIEAFNKISVKGEASVDKIGKELGGLTRLQEGTKELIISLGQKLEGFQRHVLNSARGIDQSVDQLAKLIARAILPQLNGLQCSFDSLETSQINIELELKNLGRIKDVTEDTNVKLSILDRQLKDLNSTQTARLDTLTGAVKHVKSLSIWEIEGALKELIISQKRIELDMEACEKRPHYSAEPEYYSKSYEVKDLHSHSVTDLLPKPPSFPGPPKHSNQQSYNQHQSRPQPYKKPVDLVQVWNIAEPQKGGEVHRVSTHAEAPEPKSKHNEQPPVYDSHDKNPVSWHEPLPWEAESLYQSGSAPSSNHKPEHYRSEHPHHPWDLESSYRSDSAFPEQNKEQPKHWNVAPPKQYKSERHHDEPRLQQPKHSAPIHPGPRHSSLTQHQSYNHQSRPQPYKKPVDLVQVWSIAEPQKGGEVHRVSVHAEAPEPNPKSNKHPPVYNSYEKNPVSWQEPLPWEAESLYQSGSAPSSNHKPEHYRSEHPHHPWDLESSYRSDSAFPEQNKEQPKHWNVAPPKQYNSEPHHHAEPHLPEPKQIAPLRPGYRHSSPPQRACNQKKHQNEPQYSAPGLYGPPALPPQPHSYQDSTESHHIPLGRESWRTWYGPNQKSEAY